MTNADITVYSTSWCGFCKMAKDYLTKLGVSFKEINIEEDLAAANYVVDKTKQMGVPVIQVGDQFIIGFDKPKLDAALNS